MSQSYIDTYYRDTLHDNIPRPSLQEDTQTEVCVIGGGLAGLSTALGLVEKGKKAVLIEANRIGWGASGRNGGFVAKGYAAGYRPLVKKVGLEHTKQLHKLATHGRALIKQRIDKYKIDCGPVIQGVLGVSWNNHPESVHDYIEFMRKDLNAPLEYWPTEKIRSLKKPVSIMTDFIRPRITNFIR